MKHKKYRNKRFSLLIPIIGLTLLVGVLMGAYFIHKNKRDATTNQITGQSSDINYDPPTEEERNSGDDIKQQIAKQENHSDAEIDASSKKSANVLITDAGQYDGFIEVRAFTNNAFEDGTCTIKLTGPGDTVTKNAPAYKDASTTICTVPEIKRSELSEPGKWTVEVTFSSENYLGTSSREVTIE